MEALAATALGASDGGAVAVTHRDDGCTWSRGSAPAGSTICLTEPSARRLRGSRWGWYGRTLLSLTGRAI